VLVGAAMAKGPGLCKLVQLINGRWCMGDDHQNIRQRGAQRATSCKTEAPGG